MICVLHTRRVSKIIHKQMVTQKQTFIPYPSTQSIKKRTQAHVYKNETHASHPVHIHI